MSMNRRPRIASDVSLETIITTRYDLMIVSLGYEQRSAYLAERMNILPLNSYALSFDDLHVLSYESNLQKLNRLGYQTPYVAEKDIPRWVATKLEEINKTDASHPIKLCIDISSLTRLRMAHVIEGIVSARKDLPQLTVDFVYTVAQFSTPPEESESATVCGPVSPFFAGWPDDPEQPVAAIVGLGYEMEKAVGAFEYLEPAQRILVKPASRDPRYDVEVDRANHTLLGGRDAAEVFVYPIDKATECLGLIEALTHRLKDGYRTVVMPFGPKVFAVCSMLIACVYHPRVGVWRISSNPTSMARDQVPSDLTIGLRIQFGATE